MSLPIAGLILASIIWGASFFIIKGAIAVIGTQAFLVARLAIAAVLLILIFHKKLLSSPRNIRLQGLTLGAVLYLPLWLQTVGLESISSARSSFITSLYVPLTPLIGWVVTRKKIIRAQIYLAALAVFGSLLMNAGGLRSPAGGLIGNGDLLTFLCAIFFALHMVLVARWMASDREADGIQLGLWQFIGASLASILFLSLHGHGWNVFSGAVSWPKNIWAMLIYTSVLATCVCFYLQLYCQRFVEAHRAALIFALEAPFATIFAYIFVGEKVTGLEMFGAGLILLASIWPEKWITKEYGSF